MQSAASSSASDKRKVGILLWLERSSWPELRKAILAAEDAELDSFWCSDHLLAPSGPWQDATFEAWTILAAAAALTSAMSVGALVSAVGFRNPGLLAKMATTVDHVSAGRLVLGLGAGWLEHEHVAHGFAFGTPSARLEQLAEAIQVIQAIHTGAIIDHHGPSYEIGPISQHPPPVQGRLPLLIGGEGRHKTLRLVAERADMWNARGSATRLAELDAILRRHCDAIGRDPSEIERLTNRWVVLRDDPAEARRAFESSLARHSIVSYDDAIVVLGSPADAAHQLASTVQSGFGHIVCSILDATDLESISRLGEMREWLHEIAQVK